MVVPSTPPPALLPFLVLSSLEGPTAHQPLAVDPGRQGWGWDESGEVDLLLTVPITTASFSLPALPQLLMQ